MLHLGIWLQFSNMLEILVITQAKISGKFTNFGDGRQVSRRWICNVTYPLG